MKALDLFCGIGGFAAAVEGSGIEIVGALDQDEAALQVYRLNFPSHYARRCDLGKISSSELTAFAADFWWLSPPCQPYCVRGARRDLDDPRAQSLLRLMDLMAGLPDARLPHHLALENVAGFNGSQAHVRLLALLESRGFMLHERCLCPTELGVPSRRPRYYLAASRVPFAPPPALPATPFRPLSHYLEPGPAKGSLERLRLPDPVLTKFASGLRILDPCNPAAYTTCFTSGYGKSLMHAGSYLRCGDGIRHFAPEEIARLLHFPGHFRFPEEMPLRRQWHFLGNSLSVIAVREVLRIFSAFSAGH